MGAPVVRAYDAQAAHHGPSHRRTSRAAATRSASGPGAVGACCSRRARCSRCSPSAAVVAVGVVAGPGSGLTTGAMVGFIFLCYRFLEPIAEFTEILDQTQTAVAGLAAGARRPRHPDRASPSRTTASAAAAGHRRSSSTT